MSANDEFPRDYSVPVSQDHIRTLKDPNHDDISVTHAYVRIKDFACGDLPDEVNPRAHEDLPNDNIKRGIEDSLENNPGWFHLLNGGCVIIAEKAWYDNKARKLHFTIGSSSEHGMVDGATTDRHLARLKENVPEHLEDAYLHVEIISGEVGDMLVKLAVARNTTKQVKEWSLQDLGGGFDWLKEIIEDSPFAGKIAYSENETKPVDVRTVLALLLIFHPKWSDEEDHLRRAAPVEAYSAKGTVIKKYTSDVWQEGFRRLSPIVIDILSLYEHLQSVFSEKYVATLPRGKRRRERNAVRNLKEPQQLPLTGVEINHLIPDGWIYPLMVGLRAAVNYDEKKADLCWSYSPYKFIARYGDDMVLNLMDHSASVNGNANRLGRNKLAWSNIRQGAMLKVLTATDEERAALAV